MKKNIVLSLLALTFLTQIYAVESPNSRSFRISKNLNIFNALFRELDLFYVDTLNYDKVMKSAIDDMLSKTDPYTVYLPEEETDDLKFMTTGEYAGVGAMIAKIKNQICISEPYEGMPAQRNDLRAGDVILEVDGHKVDGLTVSEVSSFLKGAPNTTVKIKLKRLGESSPLIKEFKREKIVVKSVTYSNIVAPKVGYLLLNDFTDHSAMELKQVVSSMVAESEINALILDVRGNGGGLIDEAVKILGYFLPKGTEVVSTKGKLKQIDRLYKTPLDPIFPNLKLVVLTNRSSASASEILAGAIQDLDRGVIVGERTYGKGLVQNIRPLSYGGHLKVTTAKYYIPSGRCIQAVDYSRRNEDGSVGLVPDSLTSVFTTRNGRKVRDGGGIVPDTLTVDERKLNVAYYIFLQNLYFEYANQYVLKHPTIESPQKFRITDDEFNLFCAYLSDQKFTYTSQTQKYYDELFDMAKLEGLDTAAASEFTALKSKILPDISKSIVENKTDILEFLSLEIIKRYYFQKGEIQYSLRNDKDLKIAISILSDEKAYQKCLGY